MRGLERGTSHNKLKKDQTRGKKIHIVPIVMSVGVHGIVAYFWRIVLGTSDWDIGIEWLSIVVYICIFGSESKIAYNQLEFIIH